MAKVTVLEYERVLRYDRGRLAGVLGPGRHRYRCSRTRLIGVDLRLRVITVGGQELLTADGVSMKLSVAITWRVTDPVAYVHEAGSTEQLVYTVVQLALRDAVGGVEAAALLADREVLSDGLVERCQESLSAYGVTLELVAVKDVMFAGDLKRAFAQAAIARQEAQAAVERSRGETAALRALANAARVVAGNPALLHLRTLQAAQDGATLVVTAPHVPQG